MIGVAMNLHDHNTYNGSYHYKAERNNRFKHNYDGTIHDYDFNDSFFVENELVAFSTTVGGIRENPRFKKWLENNQEFYDKIKAFEPSSIWDNLMHENYYYVDHHCSHAAYALLSSDFEEADVLTIDGLGMGTNSCIFFSKDGEIVNLSKDLPLGRLWNICTYAIGFGKLQEGKVMGLAGYGKPDSKIMATLDYVFSDIFNNENQRILEKFNKFDLAYNLQQFTLEKIEEFIIPLQTSSNLCVAGGVAYNGYMNELLTKHWNNVYIPPAPGDEGQSIGCYMHACYVIKREKHKPKLYSGKEYEYEGTERADYKEIAKSIADGAIVGWYQGKSESGNRALGNRSILADPRNPNIKDIINSKIKLREDFRPFAPSVLEEYYQEYFDTNQPSPYMSRIMPVISDKIPGVTHVDGTARIQTVNKDQNEKYYNIINEFYKITGIPMLLNTSFNCQEPIVETPEDAIKTFNKVDIDILVINDWVIRK